MQRLSGKDVEVRMFSGTRVLFESVSLNLDDGMSSVTDQGYPNGWVGGEVQGDGEIVVSSETLLVLNGEAESAGSWEGIPAVDMTFLASVGDLYLNVTVHGVKLKFPGFDFDGKGGEKATHTIPFLVTGEDFVHINGVPLAKKRV